MRIQGVESRTDERGAAVPIRVIPLAGPPLAVLGVDDRWYDPGADFFRVRLADGSRTLLRHDLESDRWSVLHHQLLDA